MSATPLDRVAERLLDILECIDKVVGYVEGYDLERFAADSRTIDAVVRNLQIVGEAVRFVPDDLLRRVPAIPWRNVRDARNLFAHDYGAVNTTVVWRIVSEELVHPKAAVERLLADRPPPPR